MNNFAARYQQLNPEQQKAVDTIEGPLLVIAGPGTGKTELLSMRTANILATTDTLPENILCLTFTDSGATAMRSRLADIIGPEAYKVAIQTFHSFGADTINQHRALFYHGAEFQAADELSTYEILTNIFDELDYTNPLASKLNGEYTYLRDVMTAISELKQAGLSSDELLDIVAANDETLDAVETDLSKVFSEKISLGMLEKLAPIAQAVAALPLPSLPPAVTPLANELALSLARAIDATTETKKTTPITAWRNAWMEKNEASVFVFKSRARHAKLRALSHIYYTYLTRMEQAALYDYDNMVLGLVHGMELHPDLKANLQEKYHYIMVDEFQDTNLAQLRILFDLTSSTIGDAPNIMAVGDDDQAIYSFQGADVNNIHRFREQYPDFKHVVLIKNYRSSQAILDRSREVIVQANGRLEDSMQIDKKLVAQTSSTASVAAIVTLPTKSDERSWVAHSIARAIEDGTQPGDIAVIARRHSELVELVPYLHHAGIAVNYERRDNVLDLPAIETLEILASVVVAIFGSDPEYVDSRLPELLAHPMYDVDPEVIWRLSLSAHRNSLTWLETMLVTPELKSLADWLLARASGVTHQSLEVMVDQLIGVPSDENSGDEFRSPFYEYFFGGDVLDNDPDAYITVLEALRTLRTKLREYHPNETIHLTDFLEFIRMHRALGSSIASVRSRAASSKNAVNLLTAHKSKGLEFDTVHILNSVDNAWGERVRHRSRLISYPENLRISPLADSYDERLRLYYVAMTRAKRALHISASVTDESGKDTLVASFLAGTSLTRETPDIEHSSKELTKLSEIAWHDRITTSPTQSMKQLLTPLLETYKLSSTHLNNFIDITRGGPQTFLMNNLLRFPQGKSASAAFGTAIHATLQRAHNHVAATGERRPTEDVLGDFITELERQRLDETEFAVMSKRGTEALSGFLQQYYQAFQPQQKAELNLAGQNVVLDGVRLTGSLDLIEIDEQTVTVTDYKTGKPSRSWKGSSDAEKIKLHKYKQQLMLYELLLKHSRDYHHYQFDGGVLQFVEPDRNGKFHALTESFSDDELVRFTKLISAVWQAIMTLDFPDTSQFEPNYKGILAFEEYLIDKYLKSVL